ncbi:YlbF family regulator [Alicyclobacillus tolerans]|uniref:Cell fate regulator YmcA, YheA/YmcA/DUF963 family (Controls sporulation, competence, biofilm development) n=2 Tax=Alicyclobacillus tolerans TaxID=90970 RepID=A0A1M6X6F2_9BACL|nr:MULTISPECIES: YlbF family regulator [Alicyclobacillus]MDP9728929.1 cell fate (sporulation/competence/biofilm development) regulator YmcA (YheA/YmcA/DUF963 family) [Alicyclobacillus tengchongensis]QRF23647.1 YlbF family regulator [Alicyclobacillus sp. TC]SHL01602.1 Cell fate regulator YmcA, YheA/YmcA/DUF963 family (controls sporulation, competence, biofilm development) [Alicyclobacillus montanus]
MNVNLLESPPTPLWQSKADAIVRLIFTSDVAERFWEAREKMSRHERAQELFEELKKQTNQLLVLESHYGEVHERTSIARTRMQEIEAELAGIPVAYQYREAHDELNNLLQEVMTRLLQRLGAVLPVEPGPRQGCGQGPDGQGCSCGGHHG